MTSYKNTCCLENMVPGLVACFVSFGAGVALRNSICTEVDGIVCFHGIIMADNRYH